MPTFITYKKLVRAFSVLFFIAIFSAGNFAVYSQEIFLGQILRGDKVSIEVLEQEELNGTYIISSDGILEFPLVSDVIRAEGLSLNELAAKIKEGLEKDYFYQATVIVKPAEEGVVEEVSSKYEGGVVYVYGMVVSPGAIKIPEDEVLTVSKVIIRSGGFKDFANRKKVKLIRKSSVTGATKTIMVNLVNVLHKGKLEEDRAVQNGDIIVVPEKFFNF